MIKKYKKRFRKSTYEIKQMYKSYSKSWGNLYYGNEKIAHGSRRKTPKTGK